ncbi:MAG: hypothetical protein RLZZ126_1881 [Pseudomonadota bacterium]
MMFSSFFNVCTAQQKEDRVHIQQAWTRATVPGQKATGAFMTLTAREPLRLVAVASPVAGVAEIHEMKLDNGVMRMREVAGGLALAAGQALELKPGGYHIMLMDLKVALPKDASVPVTLSFKDAKGAASTVELKLPVAASSPFAAPTAGPAPASEHGAHKH